MQIDAVILAGARNTGKLKEFSSCDAEAMIPLCDRPMIDYVIEVLQQTDEIGKIIVVGPESLQSHIRPPLEFVLSGETFSENLQRGVACAKKESMILLASSDIPLLTRDAVEDFLRRCSELSGDLFYPIISREATEKMLPDVQRTWFNVREGAFTGGNIFLISHKLGRESKKFIDKVMAMRKKPWKMLRLLGLVFIVKFLLKSLTISELEKQAEKVFGLKGVAIISPYPEIGIDVDKPDDHRRLEELICGHGQSDDTSQGG